MSLIFGKKVEIELVTKDRYGKTIGIISYKGKNVNEEMARSVYAWVYRKYCDKEFCSDWLELEKKAKEAKIGLWKESNPIQPWEWRTN